MDIATDDILKEVRENMGKLSGCPIHDFSIAIDRHSKKPLTNPALFCMWKCSRCGGYVDTSSKRWYEDGLSHSKAVIQNVTNQNGNSPRSI